MRRFGTNPGDLLRQPLTLTGIFLVCLGAAGCHRFIDEMTRKDISWDAKIKGAFKADPNPLVVLRDHSEDGDMRARALSSLREPKQHGGTDEDQTTIVTILVEAATKDRLAICRMAAIQSLGKFKDSRAVDALVAAYDLSPVAFRTQPEVIGIIQGQALKSLGETRNPAAIDKLARVACEPKLDSSAPDLEKQQSSDLRLAAVRALGNFKNTRSVEALVQVMQQEKDVAMLDGARESLTASTGKRVPDDPAAWGKLVEQSRVAEARNTGDSKVKQAGWFGQ